MSNKLPNLVTLPPLPHSSIRPHTGQLRNLDLTHIKEAKTREKLLMKIFEVKMFLCASR